MNNPEYYNEEIQLKLTLLMQEQGIILESIETGEYEIFSLLSEDFEEIVQLSNLPVFGWGNVMLKVASAIAKKISGGSSAK